MASFFQDVVNSFKKFPGIGTRLAEKLTFHILNLNKEDVKNFTDSIINFKNNIKHCKNCGMISQNEYCNICKSQKRDHSLICIVKNSQDVLRIEKAHIYNGSYHVLNTILNPIKNINEDKLNIKSLITRIKTGKIKEIIFTIEETTDGNATKQFLTNLIKKNNNKIKITRLPIGIPFGSDIEYLDEETLKKSLINRVEY